MSDDDKKDPLSDALGMSGLPTSKAVSDIVSKAHSDSATTDFEMARLNLHTIINNGMSSLDNLSQIADQSQSARVYEVYSTLIKTLVDANKDLLELQKKIRDISSADAPIGSEAKTINNNLFVGSTSELQRVIENLKNGNQ